VSGAAAGDQRDQRVGRLVAELAERELDALLVGTPVNMRYLTGFTGSHGLALIEAQGSGPGADARRRFFTDFRYTTQSAEQLPASFEREIVSGNLLDAAARALGGSSGRLGFDDAGLTVAEHSRLRASLAQEWELTPTAGAVERLRAVKDAGELERMRGAAELADEALRGVLEDGLVDRT
jgi:Xaa-Pro aminopeptidase